MCVCVCVCVYFLNYNLNKTYVIGGLVSLVVQLVKNLPAMWKTWVWSLGWEDLLEESITTHSSKSLENPQGQSWLASYSPWGHKEWDMIESLSTAQQSIGGSTSKESTCQCRRPGFALWFGKILWRRNLQPTPVFLPWEIPWTEEPGRLQSMGCQELDTT